VNSNVVTRLVGDEMILLDSVSGNYFSLNAVAARIWEMGQAGLSRITICESIVSEFDVEPSTAALDLGELESKLRSLGLSLFG